MIFLAGNYTYHTTIQESVNLTMDTQVVTHETLMQVREFPTFFAFRPPV